MTTNIQGFIADLTSNTSLAKINQLLPKMYGLPSGNYELTNTTGETKGSDAVVSLFLLNRKTGDEVVIAIKGDAKLVDTKYRWFLTNANATSKAGGGRRWSINGAIRPEL